MQRVNPNLIIVLHYAGKALWLVLAAVFAVIGYQLYALGIQSAGNAQATLPLGISITLDSAGPGLVVMVMALFCSLVGAVRSRVELTPQAIHLAASYGVSDPGVIDGIETLEMVWGLTEICQLYRTPVTDLVSGEEANQIAELQSRSPVPENWWRDACSIVRSSDRFEEWLRALPNRMKRGRRLDSSLPWCIRLRWGAGVTDSVDLFVYATWDRRKADRLARWSRRPATTAAGRQVVDDRPTQG